MQATVEELETSNEELQSTNEELVASNEELQSTNEELHSVNQELFTVNVEHQRKIAELMELTDDMDNFLRSTAIATLFLDRELRIRRFTPAIALVFNLIEQDIGRPIDQFSGNIQSDEFLMDVHRVLATGRPIECDVTAQNGALFLQRISPYCAANGDVEGVVAVFTEISVLREFGSRVKLLQEDIGAMRSIVSSIATQFTNETNDGPDNIVDLRAKLRAKLTGLQRYCELIARPLKLENISSKKILDEVIEDLSSTFAAARQCITSSELTDCQADAFEFKMLLEILLTNALDNLPASGGRIHVHSDTISNRITFCISDNGNGIPAIESQQVLHPFFQVSRPHNPARIGIGLTLGKRIVERHGGNLWFESTPGALTRFYFSLRRTIQTAPAPTRVDDA